MNSNLSNIGTGPISRAGINQYTSVFAGHGDVATTALGDAASHRVVHEPESQMPITLVPGLSSRAAPLRAAAGDDGLISRWRQPSRTTNP